MFHPLMGKTKNRRGLSPFYLLGQQLENFYRDYCTLGEARW
jgi:hypothetical protein